MRPRSHTTAPALLATALAVTLAAALASAPPSSAQPADSPWAKVDAAFGAPGKDLPGGVHPFGWPRRDLHVKICNMPAQAALGPASWGAVVTTRQRDVD